MKADEAVQQRFTRLVGRTALREPAADADALAALNPGRRGVKALALVACLAILAAGLWAWRARPQPQPVAVHSVSPSIFTSPTGLMVVAVSGRVRRPGLVRLPTGSRVADALDAAGGVEPGVDLSFVNLARKLVDGELLVIGVTPPPGLPDPGSADGAAAGPVNLNTATSAQLDALPGVGPVLAQHIIDYRTKHGGFRSVSDLRQVTGIGDAKYEQLKDLVTV